MNETRSRTGEKFEDQAVVFPNQEIVCGLKKEHQDLLQQGPRHHPRLSHSDHVVLGVHDRSASEADVCHFGAFGDGALFYRRLHRSGGLSVGNPAKNAGTIDHLPHLD